MLLREIARIAERTKDGDPRVTDVRDPELFAILCLQTAYPDAYLDILENGGDDSELFRRYFFESGDDSSLEAEQDERALLEWEKKLGEVGIETTAYRFKPLAERIAKVLTSKSGVDGERFARALSQAVTTSSGMDSASASSSRGPKAYDSKSRSARTLEKAAGVTGDSLRLPQLFAEQIEKHPDVRVGVPFSDARHWVIELKGKRMGMITVNKKSFHLQLEVRWLSVRQPGLFLERFREAFRAEQNRLRADEKVVVIENIGPTENGLVDRLAEFWLGLVDEEVARRS